MEILRVEHLSKIYGKGENEVRALDDVSFSVEKGQFVAIIGPSGSGKSTLLHILGGVDRPTSGKVFLEGQDVFAQNEDQLAIFRRRQVGLIYQFYNLIPVLNVTENITLPVLMDGRKVNQERLNDLLTTLNLHGREKHLPNQLSGGQQQRVSIGRALMNSPAVVLADEPTGNGRRESTRRKAYARMTNTFFEKGTDKLEDMIASIDHGYMLFETDNGMEDPKNWAIQCVAQYGIEIKDGKLTENYVSPVVMSGYVPDLLKSISMISDDFVITGTGSCGKGYKEWVRVSDGGPALKVKVKLG